MKNKLTDLNNHLFEALERVNNEDLEGQDLKDEITRARAVAALGREIVNNARVVLDAEELAHTAIPGGVKALPNFITGQPELEAIDGEKK